MMFYLMFNTWVGTGIDQKTDKPLNDDTILILKNSWRSISASQMFKIYRIESY